MNKNWITTAIILVVTFLIYNFFTGRYNAMVTMEEHVNTQWSNVEIQYQRRYDLIPHLVNTVKGFAKREQEVLAGVTEVLAKASGMTIDPANLTEESLTTFSQAQNQLDSALSQLLMTAERYPNFKSNQNFLELQAQLEGTEYRTIVARQRYNSATQEYNMYIRRFPSNTLARIYGFEQKPLFELDEETPEVPEGQF